ncbi:MAG: hypothetical protein IJ104_09845 [Methanobrevibacter sp.]|nr:hypothetical protein [Methanobrevibacter sp.]
MNFLLSNPFDDYTKQQIAVGSGVSRATLDKFINIFIENNILLFKNSKYALNRNSSIVNKFDAIQEELVQNEIFKQQFHKNQFVKFNDDELNLLIDDDESDIDLDAEEKKN